MAITRYYSTMMIVHQFLPLHCLPIVRTGSLEATTKIMVDFSLDVVFLL